MQRRSYSQRVLSRRAFLAGAGGALVALACRGENDEPAVVRTPGSGEPRPFRVGVSSVPNEPSEAGYRSAFQFAGQAGEVVLVQRAPPWAEFLPDGEISERTEDLTRLERDLVREQGLRLFLAIDPTDPADRGRLAAPPDALRGKDFSDLGVRQAFIAYAQYLALNYKPAYMALGVEVNMFFSRRGDGPFRNFQSLYFEAYDAVKEQSADTLVFPTFQYEELLGLLAGGERLPETWGLAARFQPKMDMLAVTSFPGFVFASPDALPEDYYSRIAERTDRPVAFASVGWSSASDGDEVGRSGETDQTAYLLRFLRSAETIPASLVIWYLGRDPVVVPSDGFSSLANAGLYDVDGEPKAGWQVWRDYADRPVAEQ